MGIKSIKIVNLLSFDEIVINNFSDINCIIGKNNVGKSNLLKLIRYFYLKLEGSREIPPSLNSHYSCYGSITITYDTTRIKNIVTSKKNNSKFLRHIYNTLFKSEPIGIFKVFFPDRPNLSTHKLTLKIFNDDSIKWSIPNKSTRDILLFLFPFFEVETRHIDLYDWQKLWEIISRLKTFNIDEINQDEVINFIDTNISPHNSSYSDYIDKINSIVDISKYSYKEKVLNYIKVGLKGHTFMIEGGDLTMQSDGTNSHKFIELILTLLISLTRREYITPTLYIDEPETGLHPKRSEELITNLYNVYKSFEKTKPEWEKGKYTTPYPVIILSTHSPNILKQVIKLFKDKQQVIHLSKSAHLPTKIDIMNSRYDDLRFYNLFSDNEARLFFSEYILFVEGETELELFGNLLLHEKFPKLKKIDTYKTNDVVLKYTNPAYSNLSIPYLVLLDADKLINFDVINIKISLKKTPINISSIEKNKKYSYYGSPDHKIKTSIKSLRELVNNTYDIDESKTSFLNNDLKTIIRLINKDILSPINHTLTSTTIEGSLINENTIFLMSKWLIHEVFNNCNLQSTHPDFLRVIELEFDKDNTAIDTLFHKAFKLDNRTKPINLTHKILVRKIKIKYIRNVIEYISGHVIESSRLSTLFRIIFNGKTDTLISRDNNTYDNLDIEFREIAETIEEKYSPTIKSITNKTGGWVTRFINYSIIYIDTNKQNSFIEEFELLFPEINAIIERASSLIE